jgi:hypothetical protein
MTGHEILNYLYIMICEDIYVAVSASINNPEDIWICLLDCLWCQCRCITFWTTNFPTFPFL